MRLLEKLFGGRRRRKSQAVYGGLWPRGTCRRPRKPLIESVEPRQLLAADILLGSVYFEEATGDDTSADIVQVTFQGGADGTTLNRIVIDGDKTADGPSAGDVFFDVAAGGLGAFHHVGLTIQSHAGFAITGLTVIDGGSRLMIDFAGFDAGELLVFSVDVDEIQFLDPLALSGGSINPALVDTNPLVEGAEFQRSKLTGHFSVPRFEDTALEAVFWDVFDGRFREAEAAAGTILSLPNDRYEAQHDFSDRTAGAIVSASQIPLPTIAGTVFHDMNLDNAQDPSMEQGIVGVQLQLWRLDGATGEYVDTGLRATTDQGGRYLFEDNGGLGAAAVFELSTGAMTISSLQSGLGTNGTVVRIQRGQGIPAAFPSVDFDATQQILTITLSSSALTSVENIDSQLRNSGFAATSSVNGGTYNPALDGNQSAAMSGAVARLLPGRYQVREIQPDRYFSVGARAGTVGGRQVGVVLNDNTISEIELVPAALSINNDFAEALPASISGFVFADDNQDGTFQTDVESGIPGVEIRVVPVNTLDGSSLTMTVLTDAQGFWSATSLVPGEYRIEEVATPQGFMDGLDSAGTVNGLTVGRALNPGDQIVDIVLGGDKEGINYNFGEVRLGGLSGLVHLSTDEGCDFDNPDVLLEGVLVELLNVSGVVIASTRTDMNGRYTFDGLAPGEYQIREHTPATFDGRPVFDGEERVGTAGGLLAGEDTISGIRLRPGQFATQYDFCEHVGANISGWVYHDADNDGLRDTAEEGIANVVLELMDASGNPTGITTTTSAASANLGYYEFTDVAPGTWGVREIHPHGWIDGLDAAGTHGGTAENPGDLILGASLGFAASGQEYNFGELLPATVGGIVHATSDGDCDFQNPEILLEGVRVDLLDAAGALVATTFTNSLGQYRFTDLDPGEYQILEHQPAEHMGRKLFDGDEHIGAAGGELFGTDGIRGIVLGSGQTALGYHFCEHLGSMLSGWVYHDRDNDGVRDASEEGIGGVTLMLLDSNMQPTGQTAVTSFEPASAGFYKFNDLPPGVYGIMEVQPAAWLDGIDSPGNLGGISEPSPPGDKIHSFELRFGIHGTDYNFGELMPASIRGRVHVTTDPLCVPELSDPPISGVTIELLNATGQVIATTITDAQGTYVFENLRPGIYTVHEIQPTEFFDAGAHIGNGAGSILNSNTLADLELRSGDQLTDYDFCEHPAGSISGYVFQDGQPILTGTDLPDDISSIRNGQRTPDDTPLPGVVLELRHGASGDPIFGFQALPGLYPFAQPIRTVTNARGFYEFRGLPGGTYAVVEIHPQGLIDGIDTQGSAGGFAVNPPIVKTETLNPLAQQSVPNLSQQRIINQFRTEVGNDAIVLIPLQIGSHSVENNFSEIVTQPIRLPPDPTPPPPSTPLAPITFTLPLSPFVPLVSPELLAPTRVFGSPLARGYTWHLSVVDAGFPRAMIEGESIHRFTGTRFDVSTWQGTEMSETTWTFVPTTSRTPVSERTILFGNRRGRPVSGDFNGDGISEIGIFVEGEWFLDINGNDRWDEHDLWAKLGTNSDLPVVGDWDGDGKMDIGIFGPAWPRDPRAIVTEPGLPDPENASVGKWKNLPPQEEEAAGGQRMMQRSARGNPRADLIDHVFHYGVAGDAPVTGDFNGDGIWTIGVFRNGIWHLDVDGDGKFTGRDVEARFGTHEDLPVVGDFNGDGIDEIGIFRDGEWLLDTNRDYEFDVKDEVHRLGTAGDLPVVGDWDGDGTDEIGVFHPDGTTEKVNQTQL